MEVGNNLFADPVSTITGFDGDDNLASGRITLGYTF
jgi:hypothetical protein